MPINRALFEALQPGVNQITEGRNGLIKQQAAAQQAQSLARLQDYLKGQTEKTRQQQAEDMVNDPQIRGVINSGGSYSVDPETGKVTIGGNPYARIGMQNQKGEQQAYQQAANTYQHGIASNATSVQALHSLLGALQSDDPSSMGQIRTAMVLANGFKRYNDNEGVALTPDDKQADVSKLLSSFGIGLKDNTLSDTTRSNVVRFANNKLDDLQDAHNALKAQAQGMYAGSSFADPAKAANLGSTLGAPVDQQLQQLKSKFDQFHSQAVPNTPAQGSNEPSGGLKGLLSQIWNGSPKASTAPQTPAAGAQPPVDPVDAAISAALQKKAAKALQTQTAQPQQPQQPAQPGATQ